MPRNPTLVPRLSMALLALASAGALAATPAPRHPGRATVDTAVFAGGCFWGIEGVFEHVKGVMSATAGYAGGNSASPSYEDVSTETTGHAESVQVVYDPAKISYNQLLQIFFLVAHDPTQLNRQGPDVGTSYRSAIFFRNAAQQKAATDYVAQLTKKGTYRQPIVTQIAPLTAFYRAEEYHQHYMALHPDQPYIVYNDAPKLVRLKQSFPAWYQEPR
ncbi:MAG TPA: peptide-methionine (S)-S-oxide reductase MsrA [Gemmatimonadales bacterium]|nr:peptide-methionine (S)-S-oxide reductase MsrA [Gemmatimonadales bacterium]